jgi:hypothetical protein
MMRMICLLTVALGIAAAACASGSKADDSAAPGDEEDVKAASCGPATTLTCKPGFTITTAGCAQSHVAGAAPEGRCVSVDFDKLVGTYANPQGKEDDLTFFGLTLNADGTFKDNGGCRPNPDGPSCFAITQATGTWSIDTSGPQLGAPQGAAEIILVDSFKQKTTLFYTIDGKTLNLSTTFGGKPSVFEKQ